MLYPGLVSVTFRQLSARQIVDLATKVGLTSIEWGGDIHVPHGNLSAARETRQVTTDAGLLVSSYGSYYTLGDEHEVAFESVLDTALELGAPCIRIWAGNKGSDEADEAYWSAMVNETRRISDLAGKAKVQVAFEFHNRSLTDTNFSALRLMQDVSRDNIGTYWQPPAGKEAEYNLSGIRQLLPWLANVHAYSVSIAGTQNYLDSGEADWLRYLKVIASSGRSHHVLLEFAMGNDPDVFVKDAATLKRWLDNGSS